jgi:CRP/FNR family transcriptional regulator
MYNFLVTVCERLSRAYDTIQELSFDRVDDRLAKALLRLAGELGEPVADGTELAHYITQEELAQMLSARREVVSSALNRLRGQGLVWYTRRGKLTIDRAGLSAWLGGAPDTAAGAAPARPRNQPA